MTAMGFLAAKRPGRMLPCPRRHEGVTIRAEGGPALREGVPCGLKVSLQRGDEFLAEKDGYAG